MFISNELQKKIDEKLLSDENKDILDIFKERFENGDDMSGFLSTLTLDSEKTDYLRYTWNLYHLHMTKKIAATEAEMRKNRAGYQLLVVIRDKEALFVDVIPHPARGQSHEYFNLDHLRIIRNNGWLEKIGFTEMEGIIPGSLEPKITTSSDIYKLYKCNMNMAFELDGKAYQSMSFITMSSHPSRAVDSLHQILKNIHTLDVNGNECEFVALEADTNNHLVILIGIKEQSEKKRYFDLLQYRKLNINKSKIGGGGVTTKKNILLASGAGFIGSHLCDSLIASGHKIFCADKFIMGSSNIEHLRLNPNFVLINCELADESQVEKLFEMGAVDGGFDAVYHLAANSDIQKGGKEPSIDFNDTLMTTRMLLEAMRKHGVSNLFFASTSAVYGDKGDEMLNEGTGDLRPVSYYGGCKLASEALISSYVSMAGLNVVIFRFPNVIGPRLTHGVIYDFIRKLQSNPAELEILGNGKQCKPYIYVLDLVEAIVQLTQPFLSDQSKNTEEPKRGSEEIYNLSIQGEGTAVTSIADIVSEEMGLKPAYNYTGGSAGWKGDVPKFRYDISKVLSTGWKPRHTSDEAVRQSVKDALEK